MNALRYVGLALIGAVLLVLLPVASAATPWMTPQIHGAAPVRHAASERTKSVRVGHKAHPLQPAPRSDADDATPEPAHPATPAPSKQPGLFLEPEF